MPPKGKRGTQTAAASPSKRGRRSGLPDDLAVKCINTIRVLSADVVEKANSGHPGAPMGCAPMAHLLWGEFMNFSGASPKWANRDRFVLSNGHACALQYSMLHMAGYAISIDDLKQFRQLGSITPGHPENFATEGIEVSTGPLGQGICNAVGLCIAERNLAANFNKDNYNVVDHFTYVICGDGCLQEGVSSEACSLAGHLGLGKLIVLYDDNLITIDGDTSLSFTEDVNLRYESYNWHVQTVADGNDLSAMRDAIQAAKEETNRPSIIKVRTVIGHGSSNEGSHKVHGAPLGATDLAQVKAKFGFDPEASFIVPDEVRAVYSRAPNGICEAETAWNQMMVDYARDYPDLAAEFTRRMNGELPANWKDNLPSYSAATEVKPFATRQTSQQSLNATAAAVPELIGGSADLTPSNLTALTGAGDFQADTPGGRYLRFGVREHGMAAICNGIFAHGGLRPFCATFMNFIGYALGAVRVAALSQFGILYIMTHDSIGLGEDGPTHQPIEMLEVLRSTPNLMVFRPADGNETAGAYAIAMERSRTPSVFSLSRQGAATLPGSAAEKVALGAYVVADLAGQQTPSLIMVSSGTEVQIVVKVAEELAAEGVAVKVVSMPCWELFEEQSAAYRLSIFPDGVPVMSVEASGIHGWQKYAHAPYGMKSWGLSGNGPSVYEYFGFTVPNLKVKATEVIEFYKGSPPKSRLSVPDFNLPTPHH